jgi:capsular exopolysaccharide synthesis family protein
MRESMVNIIQQAYNPESGEVAEFHRLYSKLRTIHDQQEVKNLLITSSSVGEGKSSIAAFLATTISLFRETRTVLVDCDLRRPRVHELFGCERDWGMAEVLAGEATLGSCFKETHIANLKIITSGDVTGSPAELLNSLLVRKVFAEIKFYFDSVVIDSPPVIPVSDTLFLSPEVDGVLMVVKAGSTQRPVAKRAVEMLRDAGVNLLGAVINNMDRVLPYYYDYSHYGYEYYKSRDSQESEQDAVASA